MSGKESSEKVTLDEQDKNSETNEASFVTKLDLADYQLSGITNWLGLSFKKRYLILNVHFRNPLLF